MGKVAGAKLQVPWMQTEGPGDLVNQATPVLTDFMVYKEMKRAFGDDETCWSHRAFCIFIDKWVDKLMVGN